MAQIFRPRDNVISKASVFGVFGVLAVFLAALTYLSSSPYPTAVRKSPDQPIAFSHALHVGGLKVDCRYCHTSVDQASYASYPTTQTCMSCHSQVASKNAQIQPIIKSWQTGVPIVWNKVHDLGDFVHFPHSIHVAKGVGCTTCHGQINQMQQVQQVSALTMGWCLQCHRNPEQYVRPKSEVFNVNWQPPQDQLVQGRKLVQEYHIQASKLANCSLCHY